MKVKIKFCLVSKNDLYEIDNINIELLSSSSFVCFVYFENIHHLLVTGDRSVHLFVALDAVIS